MATAPQAQDPAGTRWVDGIEFAPRLCGIGGIWVPCATEIPDGAGLNGESGSGSGSHQQTKAATDARPFERFYPYGVWEQFTCTSHGIDISDYANLAQDGLELVQDKQVEHELWTGSMMASAGLDSLGEPIENMSFEASTPVDGVLNPGGAAAPAAVSMRAALSLFQTGIANCGPGGRGIIHLVPYIAEAMANSDMIKEEGGRLMAKTRGTLVVDGAGYPGTGPDVAEGNWNAANPDLQWGYATGIIEWRLSEIDIIPLDPRTGNEVGAMRQAVDRATNKATFRAERFAAAVWNRCCTLAVLIDVSLGVC
jgi:hypothetical protein